MVALLVLAAAAAVEDAEQVKPLKGSSLLITLGVITLMCGAIVLAGFGYFSPGDHDKG